MLPNKLSETGLYDDIASETLAEGVQPYHPEFALWSDGADKRRFVHLPDGRQIDSSDMDDWLFPEGTKFWKEFTRDGTRVETRLLQKIGPGEADWLGVAYVWNDAGDDAIASWDGEDDARATPHDVPAADRCPGCHSGRKSRVLGFSAVQLSHAPSDGTLNLASLSAAGVLSRPPERTFAPPGDATDRAALGYLHANCSHCHNQARPDLSGPRCFDPENDLEFRLLVDALKSVSHAPAVSSAVRHADRRRQILERMASRERSEQMPPLATERVDERGLTRMRMWLDRF